MRRFLIFFLVVNMMVSASELTRGIGLSFTSADVVLPSDGAFTDITDPQLYEELRIFKEAIGKSFNIEWTDEYLNKESRKMLSGLLSPLLSALLPATDVIFSKPVYLDDGYVNFRFKNMKSGNVYSVTLKENKIMSMTML